MVECRLCCKYCTSCWVLIVAILAGLMFESMQTYKELKKSYPTPEDFTAQTGNGYLFKRPSDGNFMEYFVADNEPIGKKALLNFHGGLITGYSQCARTPKETAEAAGDYTIICPTFYGCGASAYLDYDLEKQQEFLEIWAKDMIAFLHEKEIKEVITMGTSFGHEPAMYLGEYLITKQTDIKLNGISTGVGMVWASQSVDALTREDVDDFSFAKLMLPFFMSEYTLPFAVKYLCPILMPPPSEGALSEEDAVLMFGDAFENEEVMKEFIKHNLEFLDQSMQDFGRAVEYSDTCVVLGTLISTNSGAEYNTNYEQTFATKKDFPIHFYHGTTDEHIPKEQVEYLKKVVPYAKFSEFEGGHFQFPYLEMIEQIVQESK